VKGGPSTKAGAPEPTSPGAPPIHPVASIVTSSFRCPTARTAKPRNRHHRALAGPATPKARLERLVERLHPRASDIEENVDPHGQSPSSRPRFERRRHAARGRSRRHPDLLRTPIGPGGELDRRVRCRAAVRPRCSRGALDDDPRISGCARKDGARRRRCRRSCPAVRADGPSVGRVLDRPRALGKRHRDRRAARAYSGRVFTSESSARIPAGPDRHSNERRANDGAIGAVRRARRRRA